ncbi:MAG: hypothetical protein GIW99_03385 [Candidatus Eremiobacteraeota bacterium]|nr:hypothetical protein [Candidatus Eremiobacteraeota bacterium]MBC5826715.1 hypothetical protein [Candidatus Eremiobacteraeota bacterium]
MPEYTQFMTNIQEEVLKSVKQAQEASLSAMASVREMASDQSEYGDRTYANGFATPAAVIENAFGFASLLMRSQKEYALKVAETMLNAQKMTADVAGDRTDRMSSRKGK